MMLQNKKPQGGPCWVGPVFGSKAARWRKSIGAAVLTAVAHYFVACSGVGGAIPHEGPCAKVIEYGAGEFATSFGVSVYPDGRLAVFNPFFNGSKVKLARHLDGLAVCNGIASVFSEDWLEMRERGSELSLKGEAFPVIEVWSSVKGTVRFSAVDEDLYRLVQSDFGDAIDELDELLAELFPDSYCLDGRCQFRPFSFMARRSSYGEK